MSDHIERYSQAFYRKARSFRANVSKWSSDPSKQNKKELEIAATEMLQQFGFENCDIGIDAFENELKAINVMDAILDQRKVSQEDMDALFGYVRLRSGYLGNLHVESFLHARGAL
ncbi:MAG: hypothetical protein LBF57_04495 [Holosporaceae bacterium]|nr:hypothetical protein [Holosporaceae bacterium]